MYRLFSPLLDEKEKEYIQTFAAESFSFLMRKVKDQKSLLIFIFQTLSENPHVSYSFHILIIYPWMIHKKVSSFLYICYYHFHQGIIVYFFDKKWSFNNENKFADYCQCNFLAKTITDNIFSCK